MTATRKEQASKQGKKAPAKNRDRQGRFVPGKSGNPRGRPRGSTSKSITVTKKPAPVQKTTKKQGRWKPGQSGNPAGKPRGTKHKATILREAIRKAGPGLVKKLLEIAEAGDVQALKIALAPLLPKGNEVRWQFGDVSTPDGIKAESEKILRGIEAGEITLEEGQALQELLDKHIARTSVVHDRRSEFEEEELALSLIRNDERCRKYAYLLARRFDFLEERALAKKQLTAPTKHPLVEVCRKGTADID